MKINFFLNLFLLSLNFILNLCAEIKTFESDSIEYFDQILVLPEEERIFVGAKNYLLEFDINGVDKLLNKIPIQPNNETSSLCKIKGQPKELCENFVKVLFFYEKTEKNLVNVNISSDFNHTSDNKKVLFFCGTNAFKPICKEIDLKNLTNVLNTIDGISKCPFSPKHEFISLYNSEFIFYGGPTDLLSQNNVFVRYHIAKQNDFTKTYIDDSKMLFSDTKFLYSFETESFIYFLFIETAVENLACDKRKLSRIGRVCKSDPGYNSNTGTYWNSFLKATISCILPEKNDNFFQFEEIISAYYLESELKLFVTFQNSNFYLNKTTICVYDLVDIDKKFEGSFKIQRDSLSYWAPYQDSVASLQFKCNFSDQIRNLNNFQKKYQLLNEVIIPKFDKPLFESLKLIKKKLVFDEIQYLNSFKKIYIAYLIEENNLLKLLYQPDINKLCLFDFISLNIDENQEILQLNLNSFLKKIYISFDKKLIEINLSSCEKQKNEQDCVINRKDPYCVWNKKLKKCIDNREILKTDSIFSEDFEHVNFELICDKNFENILSSNFYNKNHFQEKIVKVPVEKIKYVIQEKVKYVSKDFKNSTHYWTECGAECGIGLRFKSINETHTISKFCVKQNDCIEGLLWSSWSNCINGTKKKTRICHEKSCPLIEVKTSCTENETKKKYNKHISFFNRNRSLIYIFVFSTISFLLGLILGMKLKSFKRKKLKRKNKDLPLNSLNTPLIKPTQNEYVIEDNILNIESNVPCNFEIKENSFLIFTDSSKINKK